MNGVSYIYLCVLCSLGVRNVIQIKRPTLFFYPSPQNVDIQIVVCRGEYSEVVRNVVGVCGDAEEKRENFWRLVFMFVLLHLLSKGIV